MKIREHIRAYRGPIIVNALLLLNITVALSLAQQHSRDGYLGGFEYVLYASASILFSGPFNLVLLLWARTNKASRHTAYGYALAGILFLVAAVWVTYQLAHIGSVKPGG